MEDDQNKPMPAFYCCYLLRSTVRHKSLYIGSTPNTARRISQHNGITKGGAKFTARDQYKPWDMVAIVEGFTSRTAALQFEWAWQYVRGSRHVDQDDRESVKTTKSTCKASSRAPSRKTPTPTADSGTEATDRESSVKPSPKLKSKNGNSRVRSRSLLAILKDLHLLLRSTYFSAWPLKVRFFYSDVYMAWKGWSDRVDGVIPSHVKILLDGNCLDRVPQLKPVEDLAGSAQNIKSDYSRIEGYLEKTLSVRDKQELRCTVCQSNVNPDEEFMVVCPHASCSSTNHLHCLSAKFLDAAGDPNQFVPIHGICPGCNNTVQWSLMMQELSIRCRGEKEMRAIVRRKKKADKKGGVSGAKDAVVNEDEQHRLPARSTPDDCLGDSSDELSQDDRLDSDWWDGLNFESDSDAGGPPKARSKPPPPRLEVVIEDSEDDTI